jgi:predicted amidophosphoribosyltransferase
LEPEDFCYFLGEYTSGAGFSTPTNDLIINLKIPPSELKKNPARRRWKEGAIDEVARALGRSLSNLKPGRVVVPIPPSKLPNHADYDDRLMRALMLSKASPELTVYELIKQRNSTAADHESDERQTFEELLANCYLDEAAAPSAPTGIVLVDDVLTEGKHFKVCQQLLRAKYGADIPIAGFFVARRIYQDADFDFDGFFSE